MHSQGKILSSIMCGRGEELVRKTNNAKTLQPDLQSDGDPTFSCELVHEKETAAFTVSEKETHYLKEGVIVILPLLCHAKAFSGCVAEVFINCSRNAIQDFPTRLQFVLP